jgi:FkbM family methyltransferase
MKLVLHFFAVMVFILKGRFPSGRFPVLSGFFKLTLQSIYFKKFDRNAYNLQTNFLGYKVHFHSFTELLNLYEEIFVEQVYEVDIEHSQPLIIDCGSNIGVSVLYFKMLSPKCNIIAYEPDPVTFELLKKNVETNKLSGVQLFNCAVSDHGGKIKFYEKSKNSLSINRTIIRSNDALAVAVVDACQLSGYIQKNIDLLKMDIEGAEPNVLEDLIENGKLQLVKRLLIEFHPNMVAISLEEFIEKIQQQNFKTRLLERKVKHKPINAILDCVSIG